MIYIECLTILQVASEPEDRDEYLDALSSCFNLQLPWRIDEDFKKTKNSTKKYP